MKSHLTHQGTKRQKRTALRQIILVLALVVASIIPATASAAPESTARLTGLTGICAHWSLVGGNYGRVVLDTEDVTGPADFRAINLKLSAHGLTADQAFQVWLANAYLDANGAIAGCAAQPLGSFQTNSGGSGKFEGTGTGFTGQHTFQVFVSPGNPFDTFTAYTTEPLEFTVP